MASVNSTSVAICILQHRTPILGSDKCAEKDRSLETCERTDFGQSVLMSSEAQEMAGFQMSVIMQGSRPSAVKVRGHISHNFVCSAGGQAGGELVCKNT